MKKLVGIVLVVLAASRVAGATPTEAELLPIVIPASDPAQTPLARNLLDACKVVADARARIPAGTAPVSFATKPLADWSGQPAAAAATAAVRAAAQKGKAPPPMDAGLAGIIEGLRVACEAVRGTTSFTDAMLQSLRSFRDDPARSAELVRLVMLGGAKGERQSLGGLGSLISAGGVPDALGVVIDGLAKFIYNRARAEAIGYLATRLDKLLCASDRKPFFRNVCLAFEQLDTGVSLQAIGSYLASAARRDLQRLPDTLLVYGLDAVTAPAAKDGVRGAGAKCASGKAVLCEALTAGRIALAFYEEIAGDRRPLDVVRALHRIDFTELQEAQAPGTIKALGFASSVVDAILQQDGWDRLRPAAVAELPFYAVAVLLTIDKAPTRWPLTVDRLNRTGLLAKVADLFEDVRTLHVRIRDLLAALEAQKKPARTGGGGGDGDGGDDDDDESAGPPKAGASFTKRDAIAAASTAIRLVIEIAGELKLALGADAAALGLDPAALVKAQRVARLGELIAAGAPGPQIAVEAGELFVALVGQPTIDKVDLMAPVRRALPIVVQLAAAKSADDVVKVLEAAAAPVGAYRQKAKQRLVTLNAFVGASGGGEYIPDTPLAGQIGGFAPVGIHVSWPSWWDGNAGVMLSVLNLGSLVSQRFVEEEGVEGVEVKPEPSDSIQKLFSPGVFLTKSFGGPFTVGVGAQLVPSAREVSTTTVSPDDPTARVTSTTTRPALQPLVFVAIDVSLFSF